MRSRVARTVAVALALLTLAGCNAIPTSGPVEVGLTDLRQVDQLVQFNPPGPTPGSSREDVVRGFVLAATSSAEDYSVAREYLTNDYANQWDPNAGVSIDDGNRPFRGEGDSVGVLSLSIVANVDEHGEMLPANAGPSIDMRFELKKVGDEWRISSAPNGIILDRSDFLAIWSSHELNFIGADGYLVPETRWYITRAALATEIVNDLLAGPSERMRESVRTAFPAGSALVSGTVPVVNGHAKVDFTGDLLEAEPKTLDEIVAQLSASLRLVQGVTSFELLVDGASPREESTSSQIGLRPTTEATNSVVMVDGKLGELVGGEFQELSELNGPVTELNPSAVTLSPEATSAAVLSPTGVSRVGPDGTVTVDERAGLLQPSYDVFGNIWTVQAASPMSMRVSTSDGGTVQVAAPWLSDLKPVAVRLSPDGSRIAALVEEDEESVVLVAAVVRDEVGTPVRTTDDADKQMSAVGSPIDFDWIDQTHFATLSKAGRASKVTTGGPGLFSQDQGTVPGGWQLSGGAHAPSCEFSARKVTFLHRRAVLGGSESMTMSSCLRSVASSASLTAPEFLGNC
ncbi:LpqB family beta-propeller domain-containing protein [Leucobacter coleopterorum]|uniref:LpqB family beta-propeller domain-containing protein n=1 Tax=Leucobacter coleopterorum TaxID=2714933 RepID=UPI001FCB991A|nr:LpqB family beta-propeller domain-containing protein [Leucobacter coleopterorum]